jgi:hypothetical protein
VAAPVRRPFAGRADEPDWVALREFVPSATAPLRLAPSLLADHPEYAERTVLLGTVLPVAWPALVRADGEVLVAVQTAHRGDDPGRDIAQALLSALEAEPGAGVTDLPRPGPDAPTLLDLIDEARIEVTVHSGFDWWVPEGGSAEGEVGASLERANATVVPTARLQTVEAAYWCQPGDRRHLRWVLPHDEESLLDAFARLSAAGELGVGDGSRFLGSYRADGLVVPVWDLAAETAAKDCEGPAAALGERLAAAVADRTPLTAAERRARAGVVGRQLTVR